MTTGPDMSPDRTPLTAEERALAQRLAVLGPRGEPSPALDARILAAAHAAAGERARPRRQQRWPLMLGVAASLVLAVGVAWRLRPLPEAPPAYRSQTVSATKAMPAPAANATDAVEEAAAAEAGGAAAAATAPAGAPPAAASGARTEQRQPDAFPNPARQLPGTPALPEPPPIVFDAPAAIAAPLPAPAPPEAATQSPASAVPAGQTSNTVQRATQSRERSAGKLVDADIPADSMAEEDVPPATADAPEVRDAWLQRIRELAAAGMLDDARASLREFIRRWPDYPLPDDLRALDH